MGACNDIRGLLWLLYKSIFFVYWALLTKDTMYTDILASGLCARIGNKR